MITVSLPTYTHFILYVGKKFLILLFHHHVEDIYYLSGEKDKERERGKQQTFHTSTSSVF